MKLLIAKFERKKNVVEMLFDFFFHLKFHIIPKFSIFKKFFLKILININIGVISKTQF